jgi:hypothetical protein
MHGAGWYVTLDSPAPAGGLTVNLGTTDPKIATVPISINIAAGQTSSPYPGFVVTAHNVGIASITASVVDGSWQPATGQITVITPSLFVYGVTATRTTASAPDTGIYAYLLCGNGYGCGQLNEDRAITFSAVDTTGKPSSIVTLNTPTKASASSVVVTMLANSTNTYNNPFVTADRPTATGQYQITTSATDVTPGSSAVVNVN